MGRKDSPTITVRFGGEIMSNRTGKVFSAYDLSEYTKGSGEYLGLQSNLTSYQWQTHAKAKTI